MHTDILKDLLIVFSLGGIVVYVFHSLRMPSLVGLLVTGVVVGPTGLSLVDDVETVKLLAEIGVVLLLFTIGLEISLGHLLRMWRIILGCGGVQILLCIAGTAAAMSKAFDSIATPVFMGFLVAMSSTAIVLRLLNERAELTAPHGRIALGVLLFQDLLVIPFMLATPVLAGQTAGVNAIAITVLKAAGLLTGVLLAGRWLVPHLLFRVLNTRSRELFLTALVVLSIGTAWVTSWSGLSLAMGAFLAGLAISESEYSQQVLSEALPFRDIFSGLFFVSIGMLLDVRFIAEQYRLVAMMVFMILILKFFSSALPPFFLGYPVRVCVLVGLALAQIGEFSFVLSQVGLSLGVIGMREYQVFLAAAVMTMIFTPFLMQGGHLLAMHLGELPAWFSRPVGNHYNEEKHRASLEDHVVIAGYGLNGRNIAQSLRITGIPYAILEMNPETVRRLRSEGQPIYFGDCTQPAVLHKVNLARARVLVIAISDPASIRQATRIARLENPAIHIIVRTRFQSEVDELRRLGADEVIPEEFETSIEIFSRVLQRYDVPRNVVLDVVAEVRSDAYQMFRVPHLRSEGHFPREALESVATDLILIRPHSPAADRTIGELAIRKSVGATVLAVKRGDRLHGNPGPDFRLAAGDVAVLIGSKDQLDRAIVFLDPPQNHLERA